MLADGNAEVRGCEGVVVNRAGVAMTGDGLGAGWCGGAGCDGAMEMVTVTTFVTGPVHRL